MLISTTPITTGLVAAAGDPASTRTVYAIVIALALIGCVLVGLAGWLIRRTRVDPELLGPLERMDDRRWRKLDTVGQRRLLDDVRPEGAEPVRRVRTQPEVDSDFGRDSPALPSFDDLEPLTAESSGALPTLDELLGLADSEPPEPPDPPDPPGEASPEPAEDELGEEVDDGIGDDDSGVDDSGDDGSGVDGSGDDDSGADGSGDDDPGADGSGDDDPGATDSGVADSGVFAGDHGGDPVAADDDR